MENGPLKILLITADAEMKRRIGDLLHRQVLGLAGRAELFGDR